MGPPYRAFRQWAVITHNEKFIILQPYSGYFQHLPETELMNIYLEPGAAATVLGQALLDTLSKSRFIHPKDDWDFFDADRIVAADKRWHQDMMQRYRYKTKRAAYKNMIYCMAERCEGKIAITPHRRDIKPGLWWDIPPEKTVIIPATDEPSIIGAATILALSRCELIGINAVHPLIVNDDVDTNHALPLLLVTPVAPVIPAETSLRSWRAIWRRWKG